MGGKGILKKVSNVELPNLELIHLNQREDIIVTTNNNSPSRMVKFDMPSFDSHTSEEVNVAIEEQIHENSNKHLSREPRHHRYFDSLDM